MKKKNFYPLLILMFAFIFTVSSMSYAYFKKEIDVNKRIDIQVGTLSYNLESNELNNKQVTISSNSYKNIEIDLTSLNKINSKYQLYYELITSLNETEKSKLDVGYFYLSDDKTSGSIDKDENKKMIITIVNGNNKDITLNIGVIGGLINNEIELNSNQYKIEKSKTLIDYSGNNYYGTFMNGADIIYDNEEDMYAIDFDGIDDYVDIVDLPASIDWENGFTIEFTAKWDEFNNWSRIMQLSNSSFQTIVIGNSGQDNKIWFNTTDISGNEYNIDSYTDLMNEYNKYTIKYLNDLSGFKIEIYVNNTLIETQNNLEKVPNILRNKNSLGYIVDGSSSVAKYFDGKIYNLKITEADGDVVLWYNPSMIFDFDYNGTDGSDGSGQKFIIPMSGTYKLETWGAQGGIHPSYASENYGGYSSGNINLNETDMLFVFVGGIGEQYNDLEISKGGFNGGGNGGVLDSSYEYKQGGAGGGGATHISQTNNVLFELEQSLHSILIVSGGGGGSAGHEYLGGAGGGVFGNDGGYLTTFPEYHATGANQESAGYDFAEKGGYGSFGQGGSIFNSYGGNGGGGGFYGGGGSSRAHSGAGGGSGYIGNSLLTNKVMYCYECQTSDEESTKTETTTCAEETPTENCAKKGHGYARITYLKNN